MQSNLYRHTIESNFKEYQRQSTFGLHIFEQWFVHMITQILDQHKKHYVRVFRPLEVNLLNLEFITTTYFFIKSVLKKKVIIQSQTMSKPMFLYI